MFQILFYIGNSNEKLMTNIYDGKMFFNMKNEWKLNDKSVYKDKS